MAGESKNLLTRTLAQAAKNDMQMYVVYNGQDYRILLSTILALVTKAKLGLENVDNTSDAQKPLSEAMLQALSSKANVDDIVSKSEWNLLIQQLSGYVTTLQLNTVIQDLQTAIQSKVSAAEMQAAINTALQPITVAMGDIEQRLTALEVGDNAYATKVELTTAVNAVMLNITGLNDALSAYIAANDARVAAIELRLTTIEENQVTVGPNKW